MRVPTPKRSLKLAISLVCYVCLTALRRGLRLVGRPVKQRLTILYYHGISTEDRPNFARQMDFLRRTACVLEASYRGELPSDKKCVAITFDDAFQNLIENALPELSARSFHSTMFVPVGLVGKNPTWEMEEGNHDSDEVVMTAEQLRALSLSTVSLGSHTISHPSMFTLDKKLAREEIEGSRHQLAKLCGREILLFSFPYGHHDSSTVEMCTDAGYECVYSIIPEEVDTATSEILRGRTKVDPSDWPIEFFLKTKGAYVWTAQIASLRLKLRSIIGSKPEQSAMPRFYPKKETNGLGRNEAIRRRGD